MTTQPDHATEARKWLGDDPLGNGSSDQTRDALAVATAHALLAIHDQLADIARRLPRPVVNDLRAEVQPSAHPGGFLPEPEVTIRMDAATASVADEIRAQVANMHRPAGPDQKDDQ